MVYEKIFLRRIYLIFSSFIFILILLLSRLFIIHIIESPRLSKISANQHESIILLNPPRGIIYDRNFRPLAVNLQTWSVFASPNKIEKKESVAKLLSKKLDLDKDRLLNRLNRDRAFVWVKRRLSHEIYKELKALEIKGIEFKREPKRFYPGGFLASHILGFTGIDNQGLGGVEFQFDKELRGFYGYRLVKRDALGRVFANIESDSVNPVPGLNLVLTIDKTIQYIAEKKLDEAMKSWQARRGCVIILNPETGEILAMANRPTFDPNHHRDFPEINRKNLGVSFIFEPGSSFKIVTALAALQEGIVKLEDKFYCESGSYRIYNHILNDVRPHGMLTFDEIIRYSSNIGVVKVAREIGQEKLYRYIRLLGFGARTGIRLPGEERGILRPTTQWSSLSMVSLPIGHEIAVTPIQLAQAISIIANGGRLVRPYIVKQLIDSHGEIIRTFSPDNGRRIITKDVSGQLKTILFGTVEEGTGTRAQIEGVRVSGKTGTAQKIGPDGTYSDSKFIASFIGFAAIHDKPRLVCVVIIDEPKHPYFGGTVAAPVFQKVIDKSLRYLNSKPR